MIHLYLGIQLHRATRKSFEGFEQFRHLFFKLSRGKILIRTNFLLQRGLEETGLSYTVPGNFALLDSRCSAKKCVGTPPKIAILTQLQTQIKVKREKEKKNTARLVRLPETFDFC